MAQQMGLSQLKKFYGVNTITPGWIGTSLPQDAGNGDMLPAIIAAKEAQVIVYLAHSGKTTYAQELWGAREFPMCSKFN